MRRNQTVHRVRTVCIRIRKYAFMYIHIYTYIHNTVHPIWYTNTHSCTYIYIRTYSTQFTLFDTQIHIHVHTYIYIRTQHSSPYLIYKYTFMYIHICTYIHNTVHPIWSDLTVRAPKTSTQPLDNSKRLHKLVGSLNCRSLLQSIVSCIWLFCKRDL